MIVINETTPAITPRAPLPAAGMAAAASMKPNIDPAHAARASLRSARSAALATLDPVSGYPFASTANLATAIDGAPLMLISTIALHTRNILADNRISLVMSLSDDDTQMVGGRISLTGRASVTEDAASRRRYLACQPKLKLPAGLGTFQIWRVEITGVDIVGGPGLLSALAPSELMTRLDGAEELMAGEEALIKQLNSAHADLLRSLARKETGLDKGSWRATGLDPEGLDIRSTSRAIRISLPERAQAPDQMLAGLRALVSEGPSMSHGSLS